MKKEFKLKNLYFKNRIMPASGTFGYGEEFNKFFDINLLGAIVTKGLSLKPKIGNLPPRIFEGDNFLINSIGLENDGLDWFLSEKIPFLEKINTIKIINFFGFEENDYYNLAEKLNEVEIIDALEVNISCPNIKKGGLEFGTDINTTFKLIKNLRDILSKKVMIVKISPLINDVKSFGAMLQEAGADAITAVNTIKCYNENIGNKFGGISGKVLKPIALRIIKELKEVVQIPIIGCGGIWSKDDVKDFFDSGASLIQIGTANFVNPLIMPSIINLL